ncbi:MAG: Flp pilus assembly protein CpaB [Stappiaceae bacterium]
MKLARLAVLGVALVAGLVAARLVMNLANQPQAVADVQASPELAMEDVLIASRDVTLGRTISKSDMTWQAWPKDSISPGFVTKESKPEALEEFVGQVARAPLFNGEPIHAQRLIKTNHGFLSAILPKGKRAVAVTVEEETMAGGFILPDDRVDILLTKEIESGGEGGGRRDFFTETILENIRVLAIDTQTAGDSEEKSLTPDKTATLELTPRQAELVAQAEKAGGISLALRSAEDSDPDAVLNQTRRGVTFVKFGVASKASTQR